MNILVASASRHGSTSEVRSRLAASVGDGLPTAIVASADLGDINDVAMHADVSKYNAVIVGSAVYYGRWLEAAQHFVESHAQELKRRPVWLFSVGPLGSPPTPSPDDAVNASELVAMTEACEHVLFSGRLDRHLLTFTERALTFAFQAPEGDFRDWDAIDAFGRKIAAELAVRS
jgi:menaquinone-dependent protoporphyrinogen oxidase